METGCWDPIVSHKMSHNYLTTSTHIDIFS